MKNPSPTNPMKQISLALFAPILILVSCSKVVPDKIVVETPDLTQAADKIDLLRMESIRKDQQRIAALEAENKSLRDQLDGKIPPKPVVIPNLGGSWNYAGGVCTVKQDGTKLQLINERGDPPVEGVYDPTTNKIQVPAWGSTGAYFDDYGILFFSKDAAVWRRR